jgi:hypothetical protein
MEHMNGVATTKGRQSLLLKGFDFIITYYPEQTVLALLILGQLGGDKIHFAL